VTDPDGALVKEHRRLDRRWFASLLGTLAIVSLPFSEVLVGTRTIIWGDSISFHLPRFIAAWSAVRHGRSPFWWNAMFSGLNTLGGGQSAIFYAPNAVFGWFGAATAFRLWFFFHLWLMTAGWFVWGWRRWGTIPSAMITALAGSINGYFVYRTLNPSFTAILMLLPWMFVALDFVIEQPRLRYVVLLALPIGAAATVGFPQMFVYSLVAVVAVGLFALVRSSRGPATWARVAGGITLGVALGAVQLAPQLGFSATSVRPKLNRAGAFQYSAEPRHLLTMIAPNALGGGNHVLGWSTPWLGGSFQHEVANYLGIAVLTVAIIGSITLGRRHRLNLGVLTLVVFGLLLPLGGRTPVGELVFRFVPFADHFRAWGRFELFVNLGVTMLAGAGLGELLRRPRFWAPRIAVAAGALELVLGLLPTITRLGGALIGGAEGAAARLLPALTVALLAAAVALIARHRRAGIAALLALCAMDLGAFAFASQWRTESLSPSAAHQLFGSATPFFGPVADAPGGVDRWLTNEGRVWDLTAAKPLQAANGYDALAQADYTSAAAAMAFNGYPTEPTFWSPGWLSDVLRVTTIVLRVNTPTDPAWQPVGTPLDEFGWSFQRYDRTPRLAEAYLVGEAVVTNGAGARAALRDPNADLARSALVDVASIPARDVPTFAELVAPGASGGVQGSMDPDGTGTWAVDADRPSLFVASWGWMRGWTATIDGQRAPVARANGLVLGIPVPAGRHVVHLHFTPAGWHTGRDITILAFLVAIGLVWFDHSLVRRQRARGLGRRSDHRSPSE
jgi:hypothetical protein